jgi:drug/metabolite transporter (DMT)-like permease
MSDTVDSGISRGALRFAQIVGLLILVAAFYRLVPVVRYLWDAGRMRGWEKVPADVVEADYRKLEEDDVRPRVVAKYRYTYSGQEYEGSRVDVADSSELVGSFQKELAAELKKHVADRTPTTAYVNPSQPGEAVLDRRFIYTVFGVRLLIFSVLTLFGGLLFWSMTYVLRRQKEQAREAKAHPNEPWLWRPDWAIKLSRTASYKYAWVVVVIAAVYLLGVLPLSLLVLNEHGRDVFSAPGIFLMLVGLAFFNAARLQLKHGKMFKGAEFRMSSVPGVIGGSLAGVVVLPQKLPDDTKFRVVLECAERQHRRHRGRTSSEETVVWRETVTVERTLPAGDHHSTAIPVYIAIPFDCTASVTKKNLLEVGDQTGHSAEVLGDLDSQWETTAIRWRLKVGIEEENFHRYAAFEVPVFKTAESSPDFKPDATVMQPFEAPADVDQAIARLCRIEHLADGGERLRFSYVDRVVLVAAIVIVAACAGGIAALLHFQFHPGWTMFPGMIGVAILAGTIAMLLWGSSLEIRGDHLTVTSGYAGFRKRYEVPLSDVVGADIEKEHSVNEQDHFCVNLKIRLPIPEDEIDRSDLTEEERAEELAFLRNEKYVEELTIIKRLERRQEAEAVRVWLHEKLRISDDEAARDGPLPSAEAEETTAESME